MTLRQNIFAAASHDGAGARLVDLTIAMAIQPRRRCGISGKGNRVKDAGDQLA